MDHLVEVCAVVEKMVLAPHLAGSKRMWRRKVLSNFSILKENLDILAA